MKHPLGFLSVSGIALAVVAFVVIMGWTLIRGPVLFSPGGLNAKATTQSLGGVATHAQLAACGACHPAPWSSQTMADRCLGCHADVATQMKTNSGFHAQLAGSLSSPTCRGCHTEHHGPNGRLTFVDHSKFPFKLPGAHASVACNLCHPGAVSVQQFRSAPQTCYGCHAKNDIHHGAMGQRCDQCHSTSSWAGAKFDHAIFPLNHGSDQQTATCQTCHPNGTSTYTCFGCHFHTPASVQSQHEGQSASQLTDCIRCHPGGRQGD